GGILRQADLPGSLQRAPQEILIGRSEPHVRGAALAPASAHWEKDVRHLLDKHCLLLRRQHEVAVTELLGSQGGEYPAADTEIRRAHMRLLLDSIQAQREPPEILGVHPNTPT